MTEVLACLNCGRTEEEVPLVAQRFRGKQVWICTGCMPVVIHHPHLVMEKLQALSEEE